MNQPIADKRAFGKVCRELLDRFSARFPNEVFHVATLEAMENLLTQRDRYDGEPGGWAGGLVYIIAKHDLRISPPLFLNRDLEATFGVSMGTIRRRAACLWPVVFPGVFTE